MNNNLHLLGADALNTEEKADLGILPDRLSINQISALLFPHPVDLDNLVAQVVNKDKSYIPKPRNPDHQRNIILDPNYRLELLKACQEGILHYQSEIDIFKPVSIIFAEVALPRSIDTTKIYIHKDDYQTYLKAKGQWPVNGQLAKWWKKGNDGADANNVLASNPSILPNQKSPHKKKSRRLPQRELLISELEKTGCDIKNIPEGTIKPIVREKCLAHKTIFSSESVFEKVWSELSRAGVIAIENKQKFLSIS
jgi:hypothetical protein